MPKANKDDESTKTLPKRFAAVVSGAADGVELQVAVSELSGVRAYGFAYNGVAVPLHNGKGAFFARPNVEKLLEWVMVGDPGGTMKVVVSRGGQPIRTREKSTIAPPLGEGYDFFRLTVA